MLSVLFNSSRVLLIKDKFFPYVQDKNYIICRKNNLQQLSFIGVLFVGRQKEGDALLDMICALVVGSSNSLSSVAFNGSKKMLANRSPFLAFGLGLRSS